MTTDYLILGWYPHPVVAREIARENNSAFGEVVIVVTPDGTLRRFTSDRWRRATARGAKVAAERATAIDSSFTPMGNKIHTKRKALVEEVR